MLHSKAHLGIGFFEGALMIRTPILAVTLTLLGSLAAHAAEEGKQVAAHGNYDHPAIAVARMAKVRSIDPNTALVQPPASVTWTVQPEAKVIASAAQPELK
ncbi:MAG TPA: hypothetical protein VLA61_03470 [Ideonella sp.]|nr:hypothetical protein [Ideonella sp.]HSI47304.1 hypothetical protein [Ideonella sp.]